MDNILDDTILWRWFSDILLIKHVDAYTVEDCTLSGLSLGPTYPLRIRMDNSSLQVTPSAFATLMCQLPSPPIRRTHLIILILTHISFRLTILLRIWLIAINCIIGNACFIWKWMCPTGLTLTLLYEPGTFLWIFCGSKSGADQIIAATVQNRKSQGYTYIGRHWNGVLWIQSWEEKQDEHCHEDAKQSYSSKGPG